MRGHNQNLNASEISWFSLKWVKNLSQKSELCPEWSNGHTFFCKTRSCGMLTGRLKKLGDNVNISSLSNMLRLKQHNSSSQQLIADISSHTETPRAIFLPPRLFLLMILNLPAVIVQAWGNSQLWFPVTHHLRTQWQRWETLAGSFRQNFRNFDSKEIWGCRCQMLSVIPFLESYFECNQLSWHEWGHRTERVQLMLSLSLFTRPHKARKEGEGASTNSKRLTP